MRKKIETIIAGLLSGSGTTPKEAIDRILLLFSVSGQFCSCPNENGVEIYNGKLICSECGKKA